MESAAGDPYTPQSDHGPTNWKLLGEPSSIAPLNGPRAASE